MAAKALCNPDHVDVLEKDEPAIAIVVRKRTERLGAKGDLRIELERATEQIDRATVRLRIARMAGQ